MMVSSLKTSVDETLPWCVNIQMKANKQYLNMTLFRKYSFSLAQLLNKKMTLVPCVNYNLKLDHFDILAKGRSYTHCKIKETAN